VMLDNAAGLLDQLCAAGTARVRLTQDALRQDPAPDERRRLLRNLAEVAILAGRLVAEDVGNTISGRAYYSAALDAARERQTISSPPSPMNTPLNWPPPKARAPPRSTTSPPHASMPGPPQPSHHGSPLPRPPSRPTGATTL
jgi:hypothetical protein